MQYIKGSKPCDLHMMLLYLLMNNRLSDARNIREELFKVSTEELEWARLTDSFSIVT